MDQCNWFGVVLAIKRMVRDTKFIQRCGIGKGSRSTKVIRVGWKYPKEEWIKLIVDDCNKRNPGVAGAGGVIRD